MKYISKTIESHNLSFRKQLLSSNEELRTCQYRDPCTRLLQIVDAEGWYLGVRF